MDEKQEFKIETSTQGAKITISISSPFTKEVVRQVADTASKQVRARLIKLGWTPPRE